MSATRRRTGWLLCEPNVSEGRDAALVEAFTAAVRGTSGVELLHCSADPDHHRSVFAYLGRPTAVVRATVALAGAVFRALDLREHRGAHPRIGALDVVPFVRGPGCGEAQALAACLTLGTWIAAQGVPVFSYERAAKSSGRAALPRIRRGQFEGLASKMARPEWRPDFGPAAPHRSAGAAAVGLRAPLVRFNVNLDTRDPELARRLAGEIRTSGGGLPHVRALGISLERRGLTQVSCNLTRHAVTSIGQVHGRVLRGAREAGVRIAGAELIGPVPADALRGLDLAQMGIELEPNQVLDFEPATIDRTGGGGPEDADGPEAGGGGQEAGGSGPEAGGGREAGHDGGADGAVR